MKPILTILLFLSLSSSAQYRLRMIAQDDGGVNDTLYLKDNTDSLFRRVNSVYVFSEREKVKRFPAYWQLQGAPQGGTVDWPDITNKPSTFPASSHTHDWASDITGKPSTFTPSSHTHTTADITNFPSNESILADYARSYRVNKRYDYFNEFINTVTTSTAALNYQRIGDAIHFWGTVVVNPSGAGAFELDMAFPIASGITNTDEAAGTGESNAFPGEPVEISGDVANQRFNIKGTASGNTSRTYFIHGTYKYIAP